VTSFYLYCILSRRTAIEETIQGILQREWTVMGDYRDESMKNDCICGMVQEGRLLRGRLFGIL